MPRTSAATRTELANRALMPIRRQGSGSGGFRVTIDLVFDNVDYKPEDVMDALLTKYGAGKVATDKDTQAGRHGPLQFRITP